MFKKLLVVALLALSVSACGVYTKPAVISDYLYDITFQDYKFEKMSRTADRLFFNKGKVPAGACSAVAKDSLFGRNFDWFYDEMPEFVIRTQASEGRFASIGIASPICVLKDRPAGHLRGKIILGLLPIFTVDGINENGVACCVNVVPQGDCGCTTGTNPEGENLCAPIIVRYILDNAVSAEHAVSLLQDRNIYATFAHGLNEEYHFMIADGKDVYVVEFVDNELVAMKDRTLMTNFHIARGVTPHGMGLERYDILERGYDNVSGVDGLAALLQSVWYSNMYNADNDPAWYSEICGPNDSYGLSTDDITDYPEKFDAPMTTEREKYLNRDRRKGGTWHSVHTSIYNFADTTLTLFNQESAEKRVFRLEKIASNIN